MRFDASYQEEIRLRDGTPVRLRLLRPEDAPLLLEGFEHLSDESRYRRFLHPKKRLTTAELGYLTRVDQCNHFALAAAIIQPDGQERGAGLVRFVRTEERGDTADMALTVTDELQHQGLGSQLLSRAIEAARERGIYRFHVDVLASNPEMLQLLHDQPRLEVCERALHSGILTAEYVLRSEPPRPPRAASAKP